MSVPEENSEIISIHEQLREGWFRAESPAQVILRQLELIQEQDENAEKTTKYAGAGCALVGLLIALVGVMGLAAFNEEALGFFLASTVGLGLLIWLFVFLLKKFNRARKMDVDDLRYLVAQRAVRLLQADMADDQPLAVQLALREELVSKKVRDFQKGVWSVDLMMDPWLSIKGKLMDGTRFILSLNEKREEREKRNPRGKLKTKVGKSFKTTLRLQPKAEKYPGLERIKPDAEKAVQLQEGFSLDSIVVSQEELRLTIKSPSWKFRGGVSNEEREHMAEELKQAIPLMFLSLYQLLNLTRKVAKSAEESS